MKPQKPKRFTQVLNFAEFTDAFDYLNNKSKFLRFLQQLAKEFYSRNQSSNRASRRDQSHY
jgi:hypothetical protein